MSHSNNCCIVHEPAICEDLDLHVAIFKLLQEHQLYWATNRYFLICLSKGSNLSKFRAFLWDFLFRSCSLGVSELFLHIDRNFS